MEKNKEKCLKRVKKKRKSARVHEWRRTKGDKYVYKKKLRKQGNAEGKGKNTGNKTERTREQKMKEKEKK